jgi:hypothetical protein
MNPRKLPASEKEFWDDFDKKMSEILESADDDETNTKNTMLIQWSM